MTAGKTSIKSLAGSDAGRVHILGIGNIGKLFAHGLANEPKCVSVTLLLHRTGLLKDWETAGQTVSLAFDGVLKSGGDLSIELDGSRSSRSIIKNLIVATKATQTASALLTIKHRLSSESTILFAQNGLGTVEEVTERVFPDASNRPQYLSSVNSHAVYTNGPFSSTYAGIGNVVVSSVLPHTKKKAGQSPVVNSTLIQSVTSTPLFNARYVQPEELLPLQLEKLAVNATINPLTVLFNCQNGQLFARPPIYKLMLELLSEISAVYLSLPELADQPGNKERFGVEALKHVVLSMATRTRLNTSSMLQDVRAGRETEINYINGYIIKRGKELGKICDKNEKIVAMVRKKIVITAEEIDAWL